jgi:hypothetical protein
MVAVINRYEMTFSIDAVNYAHGYHQVDEFLKRLPPAWFQNYRPNHRPGEKSILNVCFTQPIDPRKDIPLIPEDVLVGIVPQVISGQRQTKDSLEPTWSLNQKLMERGILSREYDNMVKDTAHALALIDGSPHVTEKHAEEAVFIVAPKKGLMFFKSPSEKTTWNFGEFITIKPGNIDKDDAILAIQYLKNRFQL